MANHNDCPICCRGLTQHVPTLLRSVCKFNIHISCLPTYNDADILSANENIDHWTCTKCLYVIFPFYIIENTHDLINTFQNINHISLPDLENMLLDPFNNIQDGGALDDLDPEY